MTYLRGRVRLGGRLDNGRPWWIFEVVNTSTGKVVHADSMCGWVACHDAVRENVQICRDAVVMGIARRSLRPELVAA